MKQITLSGRPGEVGTQYGEAARDEILYSIDSYKDIFYQTTGKSWAESCQTAMRWMPVMQRECPDIVIEIEAMAAASGVAFQDILALNLRSEIALTHYADGCTSIAQAWATDKKTEVYIAQNWDWMDAQSRALLGLEYRLPGKPSFFIVAEAGIVGKYGFNDRGVGVCLNALRCGACSPDKLPVHVALRMVLECGSFCEARQRLDTLGVASAANFLMADGTGQCASVEVSPRGHFDIAPDNQGIVCHTNHLVSPAAKTVLKDHPSANSFTRLQRAQKLTRGMAPSFTSMRAVLRDRNDGAYSISRSAPEHVAPLDRISTLATIVIDLVGLKAELSLGRPDLDPPVFEIALQRQPVGASMFQVV